MNYYAIADLHGRFDLLLEAINVIYQHAHNEDYKIITLGDYIDRGPNSKDIIEFLRTAGDNFVSLQGNHEAMMVESITTPLHPDWWVGNGGDATLKSYGWGGEPYYNISYDVVPKVHLDWIKELPLFYETEKQVFVHAGIPQWGMNLPPKNEQNLQKMQWMLYGRNDSGGWKGSPSKTDATAAPQPKHVVHGHHQFEDGPHQWLSEKTGGRTDLDCWAYHTGRLVIGVFDDTQLHAKEFLEVTL